MTNLRGLCAKCSPKYYPAERMHIRFVPFATHPSPKPPSPSLSPSEVFIAGSVPLPIKGPFVWNFSAYVTTYPPFPAQIRPSPTSNRPSWEDLRRRRRILCRIGSDREIIMSPSFLLRLDHIFCFQSPEWPGKLIDRADPFIFVGCVLDFRYLACCWFGGANIWWFLCVGGIFFKIGPL